MKEEKTVCDGGDDGDNILAGKNKAERNRRIAELHVPMVSPLSLDNSLWKVTRFPKPVFCLDRGMSDSQCFGRTDWDI